MNIGISRFHFPVTTLGPGNRIGIWFQGCSIHCEGCISIDTWNFNSNQVSLNDVKKLLESWLPKCDGITITGGEPFDQEVALFELLRFLKPFGKSILVYSGYTFENLKSKKELFEGWIDVLISEPFDYRVAQTKTLLGSNNQRVHFLTELGEKTFSRYLNKPPEKKLDLQFDSDVVWMTGIPKNGMKEISEAAKENQVNIEHTQGVIKNIKQ